MASSSHLSPAKLLITRLVSCSLGTTIPIFNSGRSALIISIGGIISESLVQRTNFSTLSTKGETSTISPI